MKKTNNTRTLLFLFGFIAVLFSLPILSPLIKPNSAVSPTPPAKQQATQATSTTINYKGEEGKEALTLLKEQAEGVEQNSSGLVVSINGKKADNTNREFWAFYVNGKMAQVGPAEYMTKTGDKIEWKIEKH